MAVQNATRETILATTLWRAETFGRRLLGLMGRRGLPAGTALWIRPCNAIHTCGMRFPIDALFLDAQGVVLARFDALRPWRVTRPVRGAVGVLELASGAAAASQTAVGDRIELEGAGGPHA